MVGTWAPGLFAPYSVSPHLCPTNSRLRRKFWKEILPRLKYHNPAVPMIVNRHSENSRAPQMSIYIRKPDAPVEPRSQPASSRDGLSKAQPPAADERVVHIDMKNKHSGHILEYVIAETRAVPLQPSAEEIREMQQIEALNKQAESDKERVRRIREEKKREEDMLKRARAAGGMAEEEAA